MTGRSYRVSAGGMAGSRCSGTGCLPASIASALGCHFRQDRPRATSTATATAAVPGVARRARAPGTRCRRPRRCRPAAGPGAGSVARHRPRAHVPARRGATSRSRRTGAESPETAHRAGVVSDGLVLAVLGVLVTTTVEADVRAAFLVSGRECRAVAHRLHNGLLQSGNLTKRHFGGPPGSCQRLTARRRSLAGRRPGHGLQPMGPHADPGLGVAQQRLFVGMSFVGERCHVQSEAVALRQDVDQRERQPVLQHAAADHRGSDQIVLVAQRREHRVRIAFGCA